MKTYAGYPPTHFGLLCDTQIKELCVKKSNGSYGPSYYNIETATVEEINFDKPMIENFIDHQVRNLQAYSVPDHDDWVLKCVEPGDGINSHLYIYPPKRVPEKDKKVISYGLSSAGYDARIAPYYKIFDNKHPHTIDPKNFSEEIFRIHQGEYCIIPPHSYVLSRTVERFNMPEDVVAICVGKSTYARCGIIVNVTPLESGWCGYVTLEIANTTDLHAKIYSDEGIAQFLFYRCQTPTVNYQNRPGGPGKYQDQVGIVSPRL